MVRNRVNSILTTPNRQIKREVNRSDIFMIVYYIIANLNCRATLQKQQLSTLSRTFIKLLWDVILPHSLNDYVHRDDIMVRFSPRADTFNNRCGVLKVYFDHHLEDICNCVKTNMSRIRLICSRTHAEVFYNTDEGLYVDREMNFTLRNAGTAGVGGNFAEMTGTMPIQRQGGSHRYSLYAAINKR